MFDDELPVSGFICSWVREVAKAAGEPQVPVVNVSSEPLVVDSVLMKPTGTSTQALDAHRRGLKVAVRVQNKSQEITLLLCTQEFMASIIVERRL